MTLRYIHAADLHLDSPFTGIRAAAPENVAQTLYSATFDSYRNIIDLCISERVDALLVAGDIYDGADRSLRAQQAFIDGLRSLDAAGIRSFVCHGNHDPLDGWEARLAYPDGCHRFGSEFAAVPIFPDEPERALVYGISYPTRDVYDNLVSQLGEVDESAFTIGLLHANVGGNTDHALYAPCTLDDLAQSGIDYWALGHVHTRQVLRERTPTVVYPGNPQGRHPNETGARGVYLVEVDDTGNVGLEFRPTDTVRWERINIDISALETEQDLLNEIDDAMQNLLDGAEGRSVVVRMTLTGRGEVNQFLRQAGAAEQLLASINDQWAERLPFVWCERIEDETAAAIDRDALRSGEDFLAEVLRTADQIREDPETLQDGLAELYQHRRFRQHLANLTEAEIAALLDEAEALAVNLLAEDDR
ncbi:MAG: DNA repair exonuclease [Chloroflexi bacterium]|nr:DNA repair exonuclease [Chloroflexota bacterium]